MNFDWTRFIDLAAELSARNEEAATRSAVSRAYYGAFCLARDRATLDEYKKPDVHRAVIDRYEQSPSGRERTVGQFLAELFRQRKKADYESGFQVDSAVARRAVEKARRVANHLDALRNQL